MTEQPLRLLLAISYWPCAVAAVTTLPISRRRKLQLREFRDQPKVTQMQVAELGYQSRSAPLWGPLFSPCSAPHPLELW